MLLDVFDGDPSTLDRVEDTGLNEREGQINHCTYCTV